VGRKGLWEFLGSRLGSKVLTEHFTWAEAEITSHRSIDNTLPEELKPIIQKTAYGMERVRTCLNVPIIVSSWYRCPELNAAVGSKDTSQHLKGEAVDWIAPQYGTPVVVAKKLLQYQEYINWDQLILEHTWIHISFKSDPTVANRGQVLSLLQNGSYSVGLTDKQGNPYYA